MHLCGPRPCQPRGAALQGPLQPSTPFDLFYPAKQTQRPRTTTKQAPKVARQRPTTAPPLKRLNASDLFSFDESNLSGVWLSAHKGLMCVCAPPNPAAPALSPRAPPEPRLYTPAIAPNHFVHAIMDQPPITPPGR